MVYFKWLSGAWTLGLYLLLFSSNTPKRNTYSWWTPICLPDSSRLPAQREKHSHQIEFMLKQQQTPRHGCILILTRLADEQSTNESRVVVLYHILMGDVGVGQTGGVVGLWRNIRGHLPVVDVFPVRLHYIVLFFFL